MQRGYGGIVHESDKSKGTSHAEEEMEKLMLHDEQELLSLWGKDGNGMTTMAGGLTRSCAPRQDVKKWSTSVKCLRETEKAPIKTGWAETDKGQPGKPNVRARWIAKEYKTHARPVLHAPTPPLEALKVVLSEIATGTRGGKVVALVDVRRAYFHAPARRRVFVELPPQDCQPSDEHVCGLLQYRLYATRDAAQILGGRAGIDTQRSQTDARECVLVCVERLHQERAQCGNCARRRHHNRRRTVRGEIPHQNDIKKVRDPEASDRGRSRP